MATPDGLYSNKMRSMFGWSENLNTLTNPYSPQKNLKTAADALEVIKEDQVDSSHDIQDLLEEQVKLLKRIAKKIENMEGGGDGVGLAGLLGGALGFSAIKGFAGRIRGKMPDVGKLLRGAAAAPVRWARSFTGFVGEVTEKSVRFVRGASGRVISGVSRAAGVMANKLLNSVSGLATQITSLMTGGIAKVGKLLTKVVAPAIAAYDTYTGYQEAGAVDKNNDLSWFDKLRIGKDKAANNFSLGVPGYIQSWITGNDYNSNYAEQLAKDNIDFNKNPTVSGLLKRMLTDNSLSLPNKFSNMLGDTGTLLFNRNDADVTVDPSTTSSNRGLADYGMRKRPEDIIQEAMDMTRARQMVGPTTRQDAIINEDGETILDTYIISDNQPVIDETKNVTRAVREGAQDTVRAVDANTKEVKKSLWQKATEAFNSVMGEPIPNAGAMAERGVQGNVTPEMREGTDPASADLNVLKKRELVKSPNIRQQESITGGEVRNTFSSDTGVQPTGFSGDVGYRKDIKATTQTALTESSAVTDDKGRVISTASTDMQPHERALLDTIAMGKATSGENFWESPNYTKIVGKGGNATDLSDHPRVFGTPESTAAGRYQFTASTWDDVVKRYNKSNADNPISDFSERNQDKAALFLAKQDYKRRTGRDLNEDLQTGSADIGKLIKDGLGGTGNNTTWEVFQKRSSEQIADAYKTNLARNNSYEMSSNSNLTGDLNRGLSTNLPSIGSEGSSELTWGKDTEIDKNHPLWESGQLHPSIASAKNRILGYRGDGHDAKNKKTWAGTIYNANAAAIKAEELGYRLDVTSGNRTGVSTSHRHGQRGQTGDAIDFVIVDPKTGKRAPDDVQKQVLENGIAAGATSFGVGTNNGAGHHLSYEKGEYGGPGSRMKAWAYDRGGRRMLPGLREWANKGEFPDVPLVLGKKNESHQVPVSEYELNQELVKGVRPEEGSFQSRHGLGSIFSRNKANTEEADRLQRKKRYMESLGIYNDPPSFRPSSLDTIESEVLKQQGMGIAKGIAEADRMAIKRPEFNPTVESNSIMQAVDQQPVKESMVGSNPTGSSHKASDFPSVESVPHTDELTLLMANSQMMA